jgi:IS4 transposase
MSSFDETLSQNEIYLMFKILRQKFKTDSKETGNNRFFLIFYY